MPTIQYQVPTIAQRKSNTCWHASALMIWQYWQGQTGDQGPMHSLETNWDGNVPAQPAQFAELAKRAGLQEIQSCFAHFDGTSLHDQLTRYGPLWCAGQWFGFGHIIVLTGVDGQAVKFNDPDGGKKKSATVGWFNQKLDFHVRGCLMYGPH